MKKKKPTLKELGLNPRALGTNPRALGINPRALGLNPKALRRYLTTLVNRDSMELSKTNSMSVKKVYYPSKPSEARQE